MEPEPGMRQHEAWSADCLQQVEEAGADSLIDPQRKCGLADRPSVLTQGHCLWTPGPQGPQE